MRHLFHEPSSDEASNDIKIGEDDTNCDIDADGDDFSDDVSAPNEISSENVNFVHQRMTHADAAPVQLAYCATSNTTARDSDSSDRNTTLYYYSGDNTSSDSVNPYPDLSLLSLTPDSNSDDGTQRVSNRKSDSSTNTFNQPQTDGINEFPSGHPSNDHDTCNQKSTANFDTSTEQPADDYATCNQPPTDENTTTCKSEDTHFPPIRTKILGVNPIFLLMMTKELMN